MCLAIDFAHERGVVHRDLKPANIMLGDFGEVYVLDWGIARVSADAELRTESVVALPDSGKDRTRSVVGTFGYMPPEQLREARADARSDVYALGAILFEMLTLERLHAGTTFDEIASSTVDGVDARPSERAPSRPIAPELDHICVRATALAPADRFESARALHDAIEGYMDREQAVVLRRAAADEHVAAASDHLTELGGASRTRKAFQELSKGLALDPKNQGALRTIARLVDNQLQHTPREVLDEIEQLDVGRRHYMANVAAISYASFILYVPVILAMGVRNWPAFIACGAGAAAASAWAFFGGRHGTVTWNKIYVEPALTNAAFSICSLLFGPLILVPGPVVANTIAFALLFPDTRRRVITMLAGIAALTVPMLVQAAGLVESSYGFSSAGMIVKPLTLGLPPTLTIVLLLIANTTPLVIGTIAVGRLRDALQDAELRLHTQAWLLRQVLPPEAIAKPSP